VFYRLLIFTVCFSLIVSAPIELMVNAQVPQATVSVEPARNMYIAKMGEWKQMLKDLQKLRSDFDLANKPSEITAIRKSWAATIAKAEPLLPQLRNAAVAAYAESPNTDRQLTRLLVDFAEKAILADDYEVAEHISVSMLRSGAEERRLYKIAGISSFARHNFEDAQQYFQKAEQFGAMDQMGNNYFGEIKKGYIKYWEQEQVIRAAEVKADDLPLVRLTTSVGVVELELYENEAPDTVGNFISLIEQGYYDGLSFHRVLQNFMAQTGCPIGDGTGGPGYKIYCECLRKDFRRFFTGTLGMAHSGPNTGGSQFFITFRPTGNLNAKHTAFGRVTKGLEIVRKIARVDPGKPDAKLKPDSIIKAEVIRKRDHDYVRGPTAN
jgi:cyclophilin family peptidyl-prolyl cis-trans isomerase|tara:strand:- start:130 stop:1269 length:1140 start_codon:yes stop_codon:yes gene_type:complete